MGKKFKVLYYSKGLYNPSGGGEKAAFDLIMSIKNSRKDIEIIMMTDHDKFPKSQNILNHPKLPINIPILKFFIDNFFSTYYLKKYANQLNPDLIHIHGYSGYYPKPPKNFKSIITFHDHPFMSIYDKERKDILKYLEFFWYEIARNIRISRISKFSYYHALSSQIENALVNFGVSKDHIITFGNGINITNGIKSSHHKEFSTRGGKRYIVMLGQIHYRKGIHIVAKTLRYLPQNYELVLIGKPMALIGIPYLQRVINIEPKRVHYLGYLRNDEIDEIFSISDCYISASIFEACQLSPLEAVQKHISVVTSYVGAIPDIFPQDYKFMFKSANPKNLAKLIERASNSNGDTIDLKKFKLKEWKEIGEAMIDSYIKILNQ